MSDLLQLVWDAHGGLDRWNKVTEIEARAAIAGPLWARKGHDGILADTNVVIETRQQRTRYEPFGTPGRHSLFTPDYTAILGRDGTVLAERKEPRTAFAGHSRETPWDDLHVVYFSGYAIWNYLTIPFLFSRGGFDVKEIGPWRESSEVWRRLVVNFPADVVTHNATQTFYFGPDGLLRRHDYAPDILGGTPVAHYTDQYETFSGFRFPTRRRAVIRRPDGTIVDQPVAVTIDLHTVTIRASV